jgi:dTDP-4-amino-4,6-dideoxygalactose transaminase
MKTDQNTQQFRKERQVSFVDFNAQYQDLLEEIQAALDRVVESKRFVMGEDVRLFEEEFASYCGTDYAIGVGSGTEALFLALKACDVGPGDEVITVSHTFIATATAISLTGATPVFVDIDPDTYTLDVNAVTNGISPKTKAVVPVHLYGQCANMEPLLSLAETHDLYLIEDAAQAHGAVYQGRKAGSMGDLGCFSFYPSKNLGAFGEAGAVITNNKQAAEQLRRLRNHGQEQKYHHVQEGFNSRLDALQAAVLRINLRHLDQWNAARRRAAAWYDDALGQLVQTPSVHTANQHIYHLYVILSEERDSLHRYLKERGIGTSFHYPIPVHQQKVYSSGKLNSRQTPLPVTEQVAAEVISLPMHPNLNKDEVHYVSQTIRAWKKSHAKEK